MGYLWANMEKIDVQASQAELKEAKAKLSNAEAEVARLKALLAAHGIQETENE